MFASLFLQTHKRTLEFYRMVSAPIHEADYEDICYLLSTRTTEDTVDLLREISPHIKPESTHAWRKPNRCTTGERLDVYCFWDEKGFTEPCDMIDAIETATPESFKICEYLAKQHPTYVRDIRLNSLYSQAIVASGICGEKFTSLILAEHPINMTIGHLKYAIQYGGPILIDLCRRIIPLIDKGILRKNMVVLKHLCVEMQPWRAAELFDLFDTEVPNARQVSLRADLLKTIMLLPSDRMLDFLIFVEKRSARPIQRADWEKVLKMLNARPVEYEDIFRFIQARLHT